MTSPVILLTAATTVILAINSIQARPNNGNSFLPLCNSQPTSRIVGGYEANITDIPFQISVQNDGSHFCGGSVINDKWILTAAHCHPSAVDPPLKVRARSSRSNQDGVLIPVKRVVQHPLYDGVVSYDIALLELRERLELDEVFHVVDLPEKDEPVVDGTCLQVSGWGDTQNAAESDEVLRAAIVPVVNQEKCVQAYADFLQVTPQMVCAGHEKGGMNACQRDSGGPLVEGNKLIGVVSWSDGCAKEGRPAVYARVAAVRDWVKEISGV